MRKTLPNRRMNRRRFLADCGKMTGIGAMSSLLSLQMTNKLFAQRTAGSITDYKALVCVFLFGGNDSYNLLTPAGDQYSEYAETRGILSIPETDLLSITDATISRDFGLSPIVTDLQTMYNEGDLSFVSNVGSLVEPTTIEQFRNKSTALPYGLFSHNDQVQQWQVSYSTDKTSDVAGTGWAGRILDIINDAANNNATTSVNLSPYGANITQVGKSIAPFVTKGGADALDLYTSDTLIKDGIDATLESQYNSILQAHHNYVREQAMEESFALEEIEKNTVINTVFPESSLGQQLLQVAKYIKANNGTNGPIAKRQSFFVGQTGYDTHGGGLDVHYNLMTTLNAALSAFNAALKEIGFHDEVVTYTASDFGRTFTPNSAGTDHGWGGNQMVMGGPVSGGRVFGSYPDIALNTSTDVGKGRQLPTTSVDELHASLAYWYGVENNSEMEEVVPNIRNYWNSSETEYPIPGLFTS